MEQLWEAKSEYVSFSAQRDSIGEIFSGGREEYMPYKRKYSTLNQEELLSILKSAQEQNWEILDLSNAGLSILPSELWKLTSLKVLYLGNDTENCNKNANYNTIKVIPDDIQYLENLEALYIRKLEGLKVSKFVRDLPKLTYLDCFECNFIKFPHNLINMRLKAVGIDCENEDVFKRICSIKNLKELYLSGSKMHELPESVCNLRHLRTLSVINSKIEKIPNGLCDLRRLERFFISGSELSKEIPREIQQQSALEIISYVYRQQTETQQYYFNESKMLIVGQGSVGKSCLLERICDNVYEEKASTEGIAIRKWTYTSGSRKTSYILNIWDFGGQEIYHSTHQFFLTKRSLYVFVWDARAEEEYGRVDYWLKTIESFAEDSPIIIAINKCDYSTNRINRIDFESYKKKYPQIATIIDISCKDNINIPRLRSIIKREARQLPIMKIKWFYEWYQIRKKLEKISEKRKFITFAEYNDICAKYNLEEKEITSLGKYLHDLGIILHYDDDILLCGIIILKPEWVTEAVYKILDSQETILKNRNGILKISDLNKIWTDVELYPQDKYAFLLKIMEKFQLCFEVVKGEYLVAELLENSALPIPRGWEFNDQDTIKLIYKYDFMPAGVMTRFIVAANRYLAVDQTNRRLCWKRGAYMEYGRAYASVVMTDSITEKKIEVQVSKFSNTSDARELLQFIRQKLSEINSTFKKLDVKEHVPCNCSTRCPFMYPYKTLCLALEKGQEEIQCHESFKHINILRLLEGIEIKRTEEKNSMYTVNVENKPIIKINNSSSASQEQKMSVENIHTSINEIQGYLQELQDELSGNNNSDVVTEIKEANKALECLEHVDSSAGVVKSGKLNRLKRLIEGFAREDGEYKKLLSGSKNIAKIVSGLLTKYNVIASSLGIDLIPFV